MSGLDKTEGHPMSGYDTVTAMAALDRALVADKLLWSTDGMAPGTSTHQSERNHAVLDALSAGMPLEYVADKLGVQIIDVERMAHAARESAR